MKKWYKSKTIWANLLAVIAVGTTIAGFDLGLTLEVQAEIVTVVMIIVNLVLRFITDKGLE